MIPVASMKGTKRMADRQPSGMLACAGERPSRLTIKNGVGLMRDPRRRDIVPTGELAGLSARIFLTFGLRGATARHDLYCQKTRDEQRTLCTEQCNFYHLTRQ